VDSGPTNVEFFQMGSPFRRANDMLRLHLPNDQEPPAHTFLLQPCFISVKYGSAARPFSNKTSMCGTLCLKLLKEI
jgi:hypothetical protein